MAPTRKRLLLYVLSLTILTAGVGVWWFHDWPVHRFAVVEAGVLYRSAQPDLAGWRRLRDVYGIRTVIDLREDRPDEPWAITERRFCASNGIRNVKLPIGPDRLTERELKTIVETVSDRRCQPVLIHCQLGKSRTGLAVAAYRIVAQGWSYRAALAESEKFKKNMNPRYAAYLRELADGKGWGALLASTRGERIVKNRRGGLGCGY